MSTDAESLWNALTSRNTQRLVEQMRAVSSEPQQPMPGNPPRLVEGSSPTAGIGTADAGTPIVRYWTVKFERGGRTYYDYVIACDAWKAGLVVFRRHDGATSTQVVREIQRDEYEHLTRKSP